MDRSGCTVVDMRNPEDIRIFGAIRGAVNIPAEQLAADPEQLPKDAPVILICYVGMASEQIAEKLAALKNCKVVENMLTIKSALHSNDEEALDAFVDAVAEA